MDVRADLEPSKIWNPWSRKYVWMSDSGTHAFKIHLCQRRRAKRAGDRDGCPTYLAWVVQDQGLKIPTERPESRPVKPSPSPPGCDSSVIAVLNMGRRAEPREA